MNTAPLLTVVLYVKPLLPIVLGTTFYVVFYTILPFFNWATAFMLYFLIIGTALTLYMTYSILKHGEAPDRTFDEGYWYCDIDKRYSPNA